VSTQAARLPMSGQKKCFYGQSLCNEAHISQIMSIHGLNDESKKKQFTVCSALWPIHTRCVSGMVF